MTVVIGIGLILLVGILAGLVWAQVLDRRHPEPLWDWDALEPTLDQVTFPADFRWGTATAHHQVEGGHTDNNWARWEREPDATHGHVALSAAAQTGDGARRGWCSADARSSRRFETVGTLRCRESLRCGLA